MDFNYDLDADRTGPSIADFEQFELNGGGVDLTVIGPAKDKSEWLINKEDDLRPERAEFIYQAFTRDYPTIKVNNVDKVYALCSRSKLLVDWLAIENAKFSLAVKVPTYIQDNISPETYKTVEEQMTKLNKVQSEKTTVINAAVARFKAEMKAIEDNSVYKVPPTVHPVTKIMLLNSSDLPISISLAIENYTYEGTDDYPDQKAYAREMLIRYKSSLVELWKQDMKIDIDNVIRSNRVK